MIDTKRAYEKIIFTAVVLAVIHILAYETAVYYHWSILSRKILTVAGFILDLILSVDFSVKTLSAIRNEGFKYYLIRRRGWVDMMSSVPLLLFDSGLSLLLIFAMDGGSVSAISVSMKFIIITRLVGVLRLFRIIRLINIIKFTESRMVQSHIPVIISTAGGAYIAAVFIFNILTAGDLSSPYHQRHQNYLALADGLKRISDMNSISFRDTAHQILSSDLNILKIEYSDGHITSRTDPSVFIKYYSAADYIKVAGRGCVLSVSVADINSVMALERIRGFVTMIFIAGSILVFYTVYFRRNVSDVSRILNSGFRKKDYYLLVKVPEWNEDHEIFKLAKFYNEAYLPAKMKKAAGRIHDKSGALSMDDIEGL